MLDKAHPFIIKADFGPPPRLKFRLLADGAGFPEMMKGALDGPKSDAAV